MFTLEKYWEWPKENGLFDEDPVVCLHSYKLFSDLIINPGAWLKTSWYAQQLVKL